VPPNLGLAEPDPGLGLFDFPTRAREGVALRRVLKESFAFGGSNSAILLGAESAR
jgi:3-oxoacyl-(acyl-carrier-protein) synthase